MLDNATETFPASMVNMGRAFPTGFNALPEVQDVKGFIGKGEESNVSARITTNPTVQVRPALMFATAQVGSPSAQSDSDVGTVDQGNTISPVTLTNAAASNTPIPKIHTSPLTNQKIPLAHLQAPAGSAGTPSHNPLMLAVLFGVAGWLLTSHLGRG